MPRCLQRRRYSVAVQQNSVPSLIHRHALYELPICEHGCIEIVVDGEIKKIGITRVHMEEDAGKNIHGEEENHSFVDLNRAGVPLMEIVSEPDVRSSGER